MLGLSGLLLAKLAASALVVALSPVAIVVTLVLLIHNDRPKWSSIGYLLGRSVSVTAMTLVFMRLPRLFETFQSLQEPAPAWTDWVAVTAGAVLVVLGAWLWRRRDRATNSRWWDGVGRIPPAVAAAIGMFPILTNLKVLAASAAAGTQIAHAPLDVAGAVAAVAFYAVLANSTVAAPILAYLVVGPRIDPQLELIRRWVQRRHRTMTAATSVAVGVAVVLYGLA
ncbi:GAP family protein [Mycobacterium parmense]|uniref:Uncharacterized protein n=1 Tax=Mycobacterium parmense TaxID=185642 RepID=A0A7I7YUU6_9MYCO|nr:GAP family protein [Mycobacterium parmense]MCV7350927.1 GAP family protein [Mycobacterium parmense]ORW53503.1 hypothetical protein AWC20_19790 [Mycobacterium parmense]BBZ45638.1 hypothetical protein MPRM_29190 [Mycobacterium parmense]